MIPITKPFLPPLEKYQQLIQGIWERNWLTNNGPLVNKLELKLKEYLNLPHLLYLNNGTIALQIAIKALELNGEIITTPFSYVATTSSIVWQGCKPVFVDIEPAGFNIDVKKIEAAITKNTSAILVTHVYGNACDIDAIDKIAKANNLKVIYDAAHCFGTKYKGKSIFEYGDISTTSFHATKLFHTIEGGAVCSNSPELTHKMSYLRNFGHKGTEDFEGIGINGKNSEFHAAMGICNLEYVDEIIAARKTACELYDDALKTLQVQKLKIFPGCEWNYAYYPVVFTTEEALLKSIKILNDNWIYPRRYFYPALNSLNYLPFSPCPVAEDISRKIMCLPLYHGIQKAEILMIARLLLRSQNN